MVKAGSLQQCILGVTSQAAVSLGFAAALVDVVLHECNHLLKFVLELSALCRGVGVQGGHDLGAISLGIFVYLSHGDVCVELIPVFP